MTSDAWIVTGGAGFIGSNFVRLALAKTDARIVVVDLLTYAGNPKNLEDVADDPRYRFVHGDIRDPQIVRQLVAEDDFQGISTKLLAALEKFVPEKIVKSLRHWPTVRTLRGYLRRAQPILRQQGIELDLEGRSTDKGRARIISIYKPERQANETPETSSLDAAALDDDPVPF